MGKWGTTIVMTPFLYVSLIFIWISYISYYPERDFDKEKWNANIETRYEMTDDLIDNGKLIGLTKDDVRQLLGEEEVSFNETGGHIISDSDQVFSL